MADLIETLRNEHRNLARLLNALDHQIGVFAEADRPDYDVICGIADYFLDYPDLCHHPKENAIFRAFTARYPDKAAGFADLLREHRALHDHAVKFRSAVAALLNDTDISRSAIVGAASQFIDAQRRHMRIEEEAFFPSVSETLSAEDWTEIDHEVIEGRDPLFGDADEDRFAALRERLLAWEREYRIA